MNTKTNPLPTPPANTPKLGARIRHPRIASAIEECQLMLTAGSSADLILVCGPTGVGKSTLGHFLVEEELKKHGKDYTFHRYDGAGHAFWSYDREAYRPIQAMDSWEKVFAFFEKHLRGDP